jgi:hypothetical protein
MIKLSALATLAAFCLSAAPAFSQDAMAGGAMMAADPMATECIAKAEAETDAMKVDTMMAECATMYPDAVAAHCMMKAEMETDAMKKTDMMAACEAMAGGAMAGGAMGGDTMTSEPAM